MATVILTPQQGKYTQSYHYPFPTDEEAEQYLNEQLDKLRSDFTIREINPGLYSLRAKRGRRYADSLLTIRKGA